MSLSNEYMNAVENEDIEKILCLRNSGIQCYIDLRIFAARRGKISILKWLKERGHNLNEGVIEAAIVGNQLDTVKWLLENGCDVDEHVLTVAVESGKIPIVSLILKHESGLGIEFDAEMVNQAAMRGDVNMLLLMSLNGADEYIYDCAEYAAAGNHVNILEILEAIGIVFCTDDAVAAAESGSLEALQWFILHCGIEFDIIIYNAAVRAEQEGIINWIRESRYVMHE